MSTGARRLIRRWSDVLHRWLGFTAGAILVVIGLTGSLLAFYMEIERGFYPHLRTALHARPASYEAVFRKLETLPVDPPRGSWKIEIPPDGGAITSRYNVAGAKTRMVTLDPLTLEVLRDAHWSDTFFTWIYDLHEYLQFGARARPWIAYVALVMVVVLLTGVGSWLLPRGSVRTKFSLRWRSAMRVYDLHKLGGAYASIFMLVTVTTGALLSIPDEVRLALNTFSRLKPPEPAVASAPFAGGVRIPVDQIVAKGSGFFPGSTVVWVRVPGKEIQTYDLQIRQAGAPVSRFPRTHLFVDQFSGEILAVYDPKSDGWGDTVLNWLLSVHDGKAFGLAGRVLVCCLGLMPSILFVTGFMRWAQKRRGRRRAPLQGTMWKPVGAPGAGIDTGG